MHNLRSKSLALTLAGAVTFFGAGACFAETLSDALASAYTHSGLLKQNQALLRAADEDVAIAQSALRPTVNYFVQQSLADTNRTSLTSTSVAQITAEFLLFDFGRGKAGVKAQEAIVMATRDNLVSVEQQILLQAANAFLNVRSAQENVQLQQNSVRVLTQELRAANDRFEVGEATRTDVALAQSRLAAARANEAAARGNLSIAHAEYRAVIGHPANNLSAPPKLPRTASNLQQAMTQARQRHPSISSAQHNVTASDLAVEIALGAMKPSVVGTGTSQWQRSNDTDVFSNSVGIGVQGTIYAGGRLSASYRQALARAEASRASLLLARQSVDQGVANAWAQIEVAAASLEATDRQVSASRIALSGAREEAALGSRTTLDVLNAEQELLNAEASRITALSDQHFAAYSLLSSMGLLTAEHLGLGVVTFDPVAHYNAVKTAPTRVISPEGQRLDRLLEVLRKK